MPPDYTDHTNGVEGGDFEDEDEELEKRNNIITQTELFKNYSEQNNLFVNQTNRAFWFEFGGNRIGRMLLDIAL